MPGKTRLSKQKDSDGKCRKKNEEIMKLQKVLKQRDGDISTMKVIFAWKIWQIITVLIWILQLRLEMADVQLTKSTDKSNDMQIGRLQSHNDELQEDMQKQKRFNSSSTFVRTNKLLIQGVWVHNWATPEKSRAIGERTGTYAGILETSSLCGYFLECFL